MLIKFNTHLNPWRCRMSNIFNITQSAIVALSRQPDKNAQKTAPHFKCGAVPGATADWAA